jgi:hypothetical protein
MKRAHVILVTFFFVLAAAISTVFALQPGGPRSGPGKAGGSCRYETAVGFPSWVTSGVWSHDRLLIVDVVNRKLFEVSKNGVAYESQSAIGAYLAGSNITRIRSGAPGADRAAAPITVEFAGGKLLDLDRSLAPRRRTEMATDTLQSGDGNYKIDVLIDWVPTGDGKQVVGYADIEGPEEGFRRWRNGFVRFDLENPSRFSIVRERLFPDDARVAMNLTYRLMASIGSMAYVALVDDQMGLYRFGPTDQELRPMRAFPAHLDGKLAPLLPSYASPEELPRTMKAVERSTMPAGLYAWENHLFLLSRAVEKGQRTWYLSKIDPERDELLWTVPVPGSAHHMMVIPGDQEWAFLEKGPVVAARNQATRHIRFVKAEQMRSSSLKRLCS